MSTITLRDLRNHGDEAVERVLAGESVTVIRAGTPVAELTPVKRRGLDRFTLLERWRRLPSVDPIAFREDVDAVVDPAL